MRFILSVIGTAFFIDGLIFYIFPEQIKKVNLQKISPILILVGLILVWTGKGFFK